MAMSTDRWFAEYMASEHQQEIEQLMSAIEPLLYRHSRAISVVVFTRLIAVMLGSADPDTREDFFKEIIPTLRDLLREMDRLTGRLR